MSEIEKMSNFEEDVQNCLSKPKTEPIIDPHGKLVGHRLLSGVRIPSRDVIEEAGRRLAAEKAAKR